MRKAKEKDIEKEKQLYMEKEGKNNKEGTKCPKVSSIKENQCISVMNQIRMHEYVRKSEEWVVRIVWICIGHYIVRWGSLC